MFSSTLSFYAFYKKAATRQRKWVCISRNVKFLRCQEELFSKSFSCGFQGKALTICAFFKKTRKRFLFYGRTTCPPLYWRGKTISYANPQTSLCSLRGTPTRRSFRPAKPPHILGCHYFLYEKTAKL